MEWKQLLVAVFLLVLVGSTALASPLSITGTLESTISSTMEDPYELTSDNELYLNLDTFFTDSAMHVGLSLAKDFPLETDNTWEIQLDEAYIDYYATDFDLRFGKQRVVWGTAMQINPTDVINPIDIHDPLGDKRAVLAGKLDYYLGNNWRLTGVWLPFFKPAVSEFKHPVNGQLMQVDVGDRTLAESEYAVKLSGIGLNGFDLSVSYFSGKEDTPSLVMDSGQPKAFYRGVKTYGADLATAFGDVGFWLEGAYSVPDEGDAYHHWIAGSDYSLANGLVLVGQYYRREDDQGVQSFLITGIEKDVASIHSIRLGMVYNLDNSSFMLAPEFTLSLADATNLVLGIEYFGDDEVELGLRPEETNRVYARLSVSF